MGAYADFHTFRSLVASVLEGGDWGSRFPVLMLTPDTGPQWSSIQAGQVDRELEVVAAELAQRPPVAFDLGSWQHAVARSQGLQPRNLAESFIDVDGEPLLDRLRALARVAHDRGVPVDFQ